MSGNSYKNPFASAQIPPLPPTHRSALEADYERFREAMPPDLRAYCLERYGVDLEGRYGGGPIRCPFGKASGQLSLNARQVRRDAEAGLGFVVLKTVIAEDETGAMTMSGWALQETRMRVERIIGTGGAEGVPGWTVTWKGRGWHESFSRYLEFLGEAMDAAGEAMTVAPSVKYHLPGPGETAFAEGEYHHTTRALLRVWQGRKSEPMPLEKDFSPTLAGDDRSREHERILGWLRAVPGLIRRGAGDAGAVRLGIKLMNVDAPLSFQVEMARAVTTAEGAPDFLIYANRLFDPQREFEGKVGVAYGGPDLSRRNLEALALLASSGWSRPEISATGDILTGERAAEYGLLGATSCQMHTLFQLPDTEFPANSLTKPAAALHHLVFHPESGLLAALLRLSEVVGWSVHWLDLLAVGRELRTAS